MEQQICTQFEPTTNTSSATKCKWCGQEKFMHEQITMAQQTAMQTLIAWGDEMLLNHPQKILSFGEAIDKAEELLQMEKEQISKAMMYALDEDGHTGSWKATFVNNYISKLYEKQNK